jgi:hypothetical protein
MSHRFWLVATFAGVLIGYALLRGPKLRFVPLLHGTPILATVVTREGAAALSESGDLWCWDPSTRAPLVAEPFHLACPPAPWLVQADGLLVLSGVEGSIAACRVSDAKSLWDLQLGESLVVSPAIGDGQLLACGSSGRVFCVDLAAGVVRWRRSLEAAACASPAWWADSWWVPLREGRIARVSQAGEVVATHAVGGTVLTATVSSAGVWVSTLPAGLMLFGARGPLQTVSLAAAAAWLMPAGDHIVAVASDGHVWGVWWSGQGFRVAWQRKLRGAVTAAAAWRSGDKEGLCAVATLQGYVSILEAAAGKRVARLRIPTSAVIAVAGFGSWVIAGNESGAWLCRIR